MTTISFIGAGNMARAMIGGLLRAGHPAESIHAADPFPDAVQAMLELGVNAGADNSAAVANADVVVLSVKPQVLTDVLASMADAIPQESLVLSIVAGMPLQVIAGALSNKRSSRGSKKDQTEHAIVRCMPNTPALLGEGITGMYANDQVSPGQRESAEAIASAAGRWVWLTQESQIDAVTAVSGSGPAYFFYLMEAMIQAGEELGLSRELATQLTVATATGAAAMADQANADPAVLRQNVTSPGGTTERALSLFDNAQLNPHIRTALAGAAQRSAELAREFGQ